jgi:hypothetical protein
MRALIKHIDNTTLFIMIFMVLSISFAVVVISRQHRAEESANSEKPCWTLDYVDGKVVNVKSNDPTCPDNIEDTPIGR